MKKTMITLSLALTLVLSACGTQKTTEPATTASPPTTAAPPTAAQATVPQSTAPVSFSEINAQHFAKYTQQFSPEDMSALDDIDFSEYSVVFLGEMHGTALNYELKLMFIKYLYENYGLRFMIEELGYCSTIIYNIYLQTGDLDLLIPEANMFEEESAYSNEHVEFYELLYEYNQTLPESEKLQIVGVDVQHHTAYGCEVLLRYARERRQMPSVIREVFDALESEDSERVIAAFEAMKAAEDVFREYLGEDYFDFYYGLRSICQSFEFYSAINAGMTDAQSFAIREKSMHQNFADLYDALGMDFSFGMFGNAHVLLDNMFATEKSFAHFLNTDFAATIGKVLSFSLVYIDSYFMQQKIGAPPIKVPSSTGNVNFTFLQKKFSDAVTGTYGICPTGDLQTLPLLKDKLWSQSCQYFLCVKNSPATTHFIPD